MTRLAALVATVLLAGCATRRAPNAWRLVEHDRAMVLVPPGLRDDAVQQRTFTYRTGIRPARSCAMTDSAVDLKPRRGALRVTVRRTPLAQQPQGWLSRWAASLEQKGCLATGDGMRFANTIAGAVPLDPNVASALLHPNLRGGFVDLGPEHRLRIIAPILREGGKSAIEIANTSGGDRSLTVDLKASPDLLGYETAWYAVEPRADRNGNRIVPISSESRIGDKTTQSTVPRVDHLPFAPEARYFRLLILTRSSQSNHDIAILGARDLAALDDASARFERDAEGFARTAVAGMCVLVPEQVAVVPYLALTVNGKEIRVSVDTTLAAAIRAAGQTDPAKILTTLVVRRAFEGKLAPVLFDRSTAVLALPVLGGEDVRW